MDPHCLWWLGSLSTVLVPNKIEGLIFQNFGINIGMTLREVVNSNFTHLHCLWRPPMYPTKCRFCQFLCGFVASWIWPVHHPEVEGWGQLGVALQNLISHALGIFQGISSYYQPRICKHLSCLCLNDAAITCIFLVGCVNCCQNDARGPRPWRKKAHPYPILNEETFPLGSGTVSIM